MALILLLRKFRICTIRRLADNNWFIRKIIMFGFIKNSLLQLIMHSGTVQAVNFAHSISGCHRIIILAYHRINDNTCDNMTVCCSEFDRQIKFIADNYPVLSLGEVLACLQQRRRLARPSVVVTFDDGYRDVLINAIPVLKKYNLPATFFVNTEFVGSDKQFYHDLRFGINFDKLNWDELKYMNTMGFEIGSHGVGHHRLTSLSDEQVLKEMAESKRILVEKKIAKRLFFAPPFGRREDDSSKARAFAKKAGYECYLTAYGGYNSFNSDPFSLKRVVIGPGMNFLAFRACLQGIAIKKPYFIAKIKNA